MSVCLCVCVCVLVMNMNEVDAGWEQKVFHVGGSVLRKRP